VTPLEAREKALNALLDAIAEWYNEEFLNTNSMAHKKMTDKAKLIQAIELMTDAQAKQLLAMIAAMPKGGIGGADGDIDGSGGENPPDGQPGEP
jgi:hypothetical protein